MDKRASVLNFANLCWFGAYCFPSALGFVHLMKWGSIASQRRYCRQEIQAMERQRDAFLKLAEASGGEEHASAGGNNKPL